VAGPSESLNSSFWTAIGPGSLQSGGGLVSGRIAGIAVDPTNANNIYIAAAGGGVWKTTNGGTSWTPLTDNQVTLAMGAIAIAPTDPMKIYAGTGEANNSEDSNRGYGILVSNDGGATWTLSNAGGAFTGVVIGQIAVDPTNENTAYAAVGGYPENGNYYLNTGVWKTTDGGTTWTNMTSAASLDSQMAWSAVVVDPNTPSILYAAIGDLYNDDGDDGVYRSMDGGTTWSLLANAGHTSSTGRIALAVSPAANQSGQHVLYVAEQSTATFGLYYFGRTSNADAATPTFTNLTSGTPNFLGGQGWYDIAVNVDSAGVVYAAGVENYNAGGADNIIRSTNLGVNWSDISTVAGVEPHTDSHAIAFDSSNRMLIGNDGGIYRYDSTVPSWTDLNANINTIQLEGIGLHPTSTGIAVAGSQDNGTEVYGDNLEWTETDGGDGGLAQISQTDPSTCYSIHPVASFGSSSFFQRSDSGCSAGSWSNATSGLNSGNYNFYPPFLVDPTNGNHLSLGLDNAYESSNAAASWTSIGAPGTNGFDGSDTDVDSVALSPANGPSPQVLYVATGGSFASTSQIFVSTTDGAAWTERDLPACNVNGYISQGCRVNEITIDPNDPTGATAFAVTSTNSDTSTHVYRTANAGATWTSVSGNLPNLPTWSVQIDTDANRTAYVSNDTGVYSSPSPYSTWTAYGSGLANAQGFDLRLNSSLHLLAVATHGRGAWEILTPPTQFTLTVTTQGNGTVTSSPPGINCGTACTTTYPASTSVTLTASAASGSSFSNWIGCDSSSGATCMVDMTAARSVTATFSTGKSTPVITWPTPAPITFGTLVSATQEDATANVAGTFTYSQPIGWRPKGGTHPLAAYFTPTDLTDYSKVTTTDTLTVNPATPVITWTRPAAITYGAALSATQLDAKASVPGTFQYTPAIGTVLTAGTQTLSVTFTPTDSTDYATATGGTTLTVNKVTPVVTWPTPAAITFGTLVSATQEDATANVAGTFTYSQPIGWRPKGGTHPLAAYFTPTDLTDYSKVTTTDTLTVNLAAPVITWTKPAAIVYGTALSATQLDATANVPGTFQYTPAMGTVLTIGSKTLSVTFTPTDATDYATATGSTAVTVTKATPVITWPTPAPITYGTAVSATQEDATANVPGSFTYSQPIGWKPTVGSHPFAAYFTPTDNTDYIKVTTTVTLTVNP
jgi:hypothetical protein